MGEASRQRNTQVDPLSLKASGTAQEVEASHPASSNTPPLIDRAERGGNIGRLLLVGGGIGIAPLVALADGALAAGARVTLILGAPTRDDLYPAELLPSQIKLHLATEDGSAGEKAMATDLLPGLASRFDQVFACGPLAMYQAMSSHNSLKGKPVQVSLETRMGCGFGVCLGCAIETRQGMKLVCRDGPVFELEDIVWAAVKGGH